ncbi:DUF885 family protein [Rathayibacter sp. YIM 133350]|uniref:DUF885 family protein n=1 Tax=Rathayibacter sp. YIM 133350 TaxID=3131992 RepID=UPI00307D85D9
MSASADLNRLGTEFWEWRAATAFHTSDDIPRLARPAGWVPRFDPESIEQHRSRRQEFAERWATVDLADADVPTQVDHRLLGSALARVHWELDVLRNWQRDAVFLYGQVVGPWFDLLLQPAPFRAQRQHDLVTVLRAMPDAVEEVIANLAGHGIASLAHVAVGQMESIGERITASVTAVSEHVDGPTAQALGDALPPARDALIRLRDWLEEHAAALGPDANIGRDAFIWYLRHVALVAAEPEDLVRAAEQDYRRAVAAEAAAHASLVTARDQPLAASVDAEVEAQAAAENEVREFYESRGLLTQPASLRHYRFAPTPAYLEPFAMFGVTDDLGNENRRFEAATSYIPDPASELPYFDAANARDPRLGIIHEGAHAQQLALSWGNPRSIRRHVYDSVPNEGLAHYNEELLLSAGLFAEAPPSQRIVHNFMRLRALRVIVDVNLVTGVFSHADAVRFFVKRVPMDSATATEESAMYVATPGLAMSYNVGKHEIQRLLADAMVARGGSFDLRAFHDYLWQNGNVPVSLLRWELLGDRSDVDVLDAASGGEPRAS